MATNVDLLGSYWTLAGAAEPHTDKDYSPFDFKDRVEAAARAGFKGIGIWHSDLAHTLKKRSLKEMKQIFDDNGIKHVELEFLTGWFLDGEEKKQSDIARKLLLTAAEVFGARHIKVGHFEKTNVAMPRMIEAFSALCTDGANHGTRIIYEMMPFCDLDSVEKALALVDGAGAKNGGICFDLWHIVKLKIPYEKVDVYKRQSEGDALVTQLAALRRLAKHAPVDTIALRTRVAEAVLAQDRYPFEGR